MMARGFTLLELLIAITLSAILALGTVNLVQQMSISQERVHGSADTLDRLTLAKHRITDDVQQFVPLRPTADEFGNPQPAVSLSTSGELTFTRHGWAQGIINPTHRSNLQRVHYALIDIQDDACRMGLNAAQWEQRTTLTGQCLVRRYRQHLEAERDNPWLSQVVLAPIKNLRWRVQTHADDGAEWQEEWPPFRANEAVALQALELVFDHENVGTVRFFWALPQSVPVPEASE